MPIETDNQQIGLASHFAMAVGRDFGSIEKLKLLVERNLPSNTAAHTKALNGDILITKGS